MTDKTCHRCGACCRYLPISTRHMHPDHKKYLLNRGLKEDKEQGFILIPHDCQHLKPGPKTIEEGMAASSGNGPYHFTFCDIHDDPDRPEVCRKWHGQKILKGSRIYVPPGCAFRETE